MSRCICKPGDKICVQSTRGELEVPDDANEVLIEPVRTAGRGGKVEPVAQGRMWTAEWGLLDISDYAKKTKLREEEAAMKARQEKERERKAREARERAEKPKEEPKAEPKEEPKAERAPSGLVKVKKSEK
jgi:hypothetical protein